MIINPEYAAAQEISRLLRVPSAFSVETFARGLVEVIGSRHFSPLCSTIRTLMPTFSTAHVRYVAMRLPPRTVICRSRPESRPRLWKNRTISCCEPMT